MRKLFLGVCLFSSFAVNAQKKHDAVANKYDGLYVFTDCTPVRPYDTLGVITKGYGSKQQWTHSPKSLEYESVRDKAIKQVHERYYNADGIILNLSSGYDANVIVAIKFRDMPGQTAAK